MRNYWFIFLTLIFQFNICSGQSEKTYEETVNVKPVDTDSSFKSNFKLLTDPLHRIDYGESCSMGISPEGRVAIQYFISKIDYTTIRKILRGQNPEGRVYALEALMKAAKNKIIRLTEDDKASMKDILFSKDTLNVCGICRRWNKDGIEKYFAPELKRVLYR